MVARKWRETARTPNGCLGVAAYDEMHNPIYRLATDPCGEADLNPSMKRSGVAHEMLIRQRSFIQKPLIGVAARRVQELSLPLGFDAFGNDIEAKAFTQSDD